MKPLLCRTPLLPGESLPSLLIRLSQENLYESPRFLEQVCQERLTHRDTVAHPTRAETFQVLGELVCIEPIELHKASVHSLATVLTPPTLEYPTLTLSAGQVVPVLPAALHPKHTWFTQGWVAFCPVCLAEAAYHRLNWLPLSTTICLHHHCLLVHRCPACKRECQMLDVVTAKCRKCQFDLTQTPLTLVRQDETGILTQRIIQSWWGVAPPVDIPTLAVHSPRTLYCLIDGLSHAMTSVKKLLPNIHQTTFPVHVFPFPSKMKMNHTQRFVLLATALKVVMCGAEGFYKFFHDYQRRDNRSLEQGLVRNFGRLYTVWLEQAWKHPDFQWVQDIFDQYVQEHYILSPGLMRLTRLRRNPPPLEAVPYITEAEAARLLGTTAPIIQRLVELGLLSAYTLKHTKHGSPRFKWVERQGVMQLQGRWQEALPLKEASTLLGVSDEVVVEMVQAGLLSAVRGPVADGSAAWKISQASIQTCLADLESRAVVEPKLRDDNPATLNLVQATQMLSVHGFKVVAVLQAVLEGKLAAYRAGLLTSLAGLRFDVLDVELLLGVMRANRPFLTPSEIAERMQVAVSAVSTWVRSGLLTPDKVYREMRYFSREQVDTFIQGHVLVKEAATILGVGELAVQRWARDGRLSAVSGPGVDERGVYLFRRADVERLRPENRLTGPQLAAALGISRSQLWQWVQKGKIQPVSGPGTGDGAKHYLFVKS